MTISSLDVQAILGFDPFAPEFHADPYAHYRELRAGGALRRTPGGLWLGLSFDVCARILRDPRFGHGGDADAPLPRRSRRPEWSGPERPAPGQPEWSGPEQPEPEQPEPGRPERFRRPARSFLALDPPEHTRLRRLVSGAFTARLVERLQGRVATLVDELLAGVHGEVDLIATLAHPLPVIVISEMLGVPPADQDRFRGWSDALARGLDPDFLLSEQQLDERDQARQEFAEYFRDLAARRRATPGEDLLSALATVEELSEADLLATCVLLLVAGHETTVNLIANGTLALVRHPDQLAYFRANLAAAPAVVEELLRYDPPVQFSARVALEDVRIAGQTIHRGEIVLLLLGAANRDPEVFSDPDRLDLTRAPERHLAFGLGIHFCLGAPLARLEGRLALAALARRDLELTAAPLTYKDNLVLRGLAELPVRLS